MAPPAKSRKGKKAWRKNIDASKVEVFLEEQTYQERRGPAAKELKDEQIFFLDTTADVDGAEAVVEGRRPAKRRREEAAAKPLRCQQIIAEAHKAKPLNLAPPPRKPMAALAELQMGSKPPGAVVLAGGASTAANGRQRNGSARSTHPLDLWANDDFGLTATTDDKKQHQQHLNTKQLLGEGGEGRKGKKARRGTTPEHPAAAALAAVRAMGPTAKPLCKSQLPARVAAVAVDIPGCSFNPDVDQHQDALALLVAAEMRKELRKELMPTAPPEEVASQGRPLTELEALQVDAASSDDEEVAVPTDAAAADPNAIALKWEDDDDDSPVGRRQRPMEKKTKKERSREARRKAAELELEGRQRLKAQRRELQSLRDVQAQLEEEQQEKDVRRLRRAAMLEDRAAVLPPRLGKLKFQPTSVQVITSDEKTGSLRQVIPCAMLTAERFNSLQQRGLVEPRKPQSFKEKRRKVTYEKGARFERQAEATASMRDLTHRNKKARRHAKAAERKGAGDEWAL